MTSPPLEFSYVDGFVQDTEPPRESYNPELYTPNTPLAVIQFFEKELAIPYERQKALCKRVRIHYGNTVTGRAWGDTDTGYITLSCGDDPELITLRTLDASQGTPVMMGNIIKIETTRGKQALYRHPHFHTHDEAPPAVQEPADTRAPRRISIARSNDEGTT